MPAHASDGSRLIDEHLAAVPQPHRDSLVALRATLRRLLPDADECIKYGMPCFAVKGVGVAGFDAFARHCSYFPMSGSVLSHMTVPPPAEATSKGTLRFPPDHQLPDALVKELVEVRLAEIAAKAARPAR